MATSVGNVYSGEQVWAALLCTLVVSFLFSLLLSCANMKGIHFLKAKMVLIDSSD
jgi:hypothetical protein